MSTLSREQATQILEEVPAEKAFYFFRGIGSPTGISAKSLGEFVEKTKVVEAGSLEFHIVRGDFESWISMLGDKTLVQQLAQLKQQNLSGDLLREYLLKILDSEYGSLKNLSAFPKSRTLKSMQGD